MTETVYWNHKRHAMLLLLLLASTGNANTAPAAESSNTRGPGISIPAGNKDRGIRLTCSAKKPTGSMGIVLMAPGNGAQTAAKCAVENTYADRWCHVTLELGIETDEGLTAYAEHELGEVKDIKLTLIDAAANPHYGDHVRLNYDRDLRLKPIVSEDSCVAGIVYGDNVVATGEKIGEFTATFESTSHEFVDTISNWKAQPEDYTVSPDGKTMTLTGDFHLNSTNGQVAATIEYAVINNHVIKKTIAFKHLRGPELFYSVDAFIASDKAEEFFSWANYHRTDDAWLANHELLKNGSEQIPAVGYRLENTTVGIVSDTGAHNGWGRMYRTWENDPLTGETKHTKVQRNVADHELFGVLPSEKKAGLRFGKFYYLDHDIVHSYHRLNPRGDSIKKLFIFVDEGIDTLREQKIAVQCSLAEGKGYVGEIVEKILYANQEMLSGTYDHTTMEAYVHPSLGYQMIYQRDAFWQTAAMYDAKVAVDTFNHVMRAQGSEGQLSCNIRPYTWNGGMPGGWTDANVKHVIWAYINFKRYGVEPDIEQLELAVAWMKKTSTKPEEPGVYKTVSAGWFDVFAFFEPAHVAHMQGKYMVALRCAKILGASNVSEHEIAKAQDAYRDFYDAELGYIPFARRCKMRRNNKPVETNFELLLSPTVLMGEFLSQWLFDEPILTDEAVANTLDKLDEVCQQKWANGYALPNIIRSDGTRYSKENKPYADALYWEPGIYHTGGSWLLYECMAYSVGHLHGWKPKHVGKSGAHRIAKRMQIEISEKDQPVSHEYVPMTENGVNTPSSSWNGKSDEGIPGPPGAKVFGWNAFVRVIREVAGLREAEDPILVENLSKR